MNHVTFQHTFAKPGFPNRVNAKSKQVSTLPQFGSNALLRQSSTFNFNFAAWKQNLPFIALASSVGLIILNKITGGFRNLQWRWPQNPFAGPRKKEADLERQDLPESDSEEQTLPREPKTPPQEPVKAQTLATEADEEMENSVNSDDTVKGSPYSPHRFLNTPPKSPAGESDLSEEDLSDSEMLSALTESNLQSLANMHSIWLSPVLNRSCASSRPLSPQSMASDHSFEILDQDDWSHNVISLPNSPFNIGSPIVSRPQSPDLRHRYPPQTDYSAKL